MNQPKRELKLLTETIEEIKELIINEQNGEDIFVIDVDKTLLHPQLLFYDKINELDLIEGIVYDPDEQEFYNCIKNETMSKDDVIQLIKRSIYFWNHTTFAEQIRGTNALKPIENEVKATKLSQLARKVRSMFGMTK